ncbi:MAG TPA: lantibiotic dehydratase [Candidatus Angelobacter sp.]|nr:lantibiotic dehydratase [Candidatus Angelobacter sp.]
MMQIAISEQQDLVTTTSHLIRAPGSEWGFWRWVCLRSAGFPIEGIFKLAASSGLISAADEVVRAMEAVEQTRARTHEEINSALDELRTSGRWEDKKTRKSLLDARVTLNAREIPDSLPESVPVKSIHEFAAAVDHLKRVRAQYDQQFSNSLEETSEAIRWIAGLPQFREAVTWQNRGLVVQVLDRVLQKSQKNSKRNSQQRQREELVAIYWQRYCTKNDTIGFFGPVGWARFDPEVEYLVSKPGDQLVKARKTYWESWAIAALSVAIVRNMDIRKWIPPILLPSVRIEGTTLHHPLLGALPLTPAQAVLLQSCDGQQTAKQIAERLLRFPEADLHSESEVYQLLREFAVRRFVFWSFNIPLEPYPEETLRRALERIDDPDQRRSAMAFLEGFDSAKQKVEGSAGSPEKLNAALNNVEQTFECTTGFSSTRSHGKTYAGRTLMYEDSRRNVEVYLGPQLLESLSPPLSLMLLAGRWFTAQVADLYRSKMGEIYSQEVRRKHDESIDAAMYWAQIMPLFFEHAPKLLAPVLSEFQRKWERILRLGTRRETITYSYHELRPRVLAEFSSNHARWIACYHSPDVMIAAASEEAIRKGDCLFVMGEAHIGTNTLDASLFVNQHPSPDELLGAIESDLKHVNIVPMGFKEISGSRTTPCLIPRSTVRLEYLPDAFATDRPNSIPISSMLIKKCDGELVASTRDGQYSTNLIDLLGPLLNYLCVDCFKIMSPRPHTPRVLIDRLVIRRESWSLPASELQFLQNCDPAESFLHIRRWAQGHGIPRFIFYKVPVEGKPLYLDLESPILMSIFARLVRRTQEVASADAKLEVSEMLPASDQLWLRDKHNQRYTSEFRLVAVDSKKSSNSRASARGLASGRGV